MSLYPNSLQIPAMLYSKAPSLEKVQEELATKQYIGQKKLDGAWYQLEKTDKGEVYLFSRSKSKKTGELSEKIDNVPHLKEWASQLPNGTTLVGEIYVPGGKSNDVTKIMGALPRKAVERQKDNPIHYYVHDMIRYAGKDMLDTEFERRYSDLCKYVDIELDNPYWLEVASSISGYGFLDSVYRYIAEGGEGYVVKKKSGLYVPGKRPTYNFKIKEETNEMDFIITALLDPEKEYTGKNPENWDYWLTSSGEKICLSKGQDGILQMPITKDYYLGRKSSIAVGACNEKGDLITTGRVSSGISDEMKQDMTNNPSKYIGSVCKIQAMSVDKENMTFRHPRFMGMHEGKNVEECKLSEIFS